MSRGITKVLIQCSDGRRYSLKEDHITRLFRGDNPLSSYLAMVFSPQQNRDGWVEEKADSWDGL